MLAEFTFTRNWTMAKNRRMKMTKEEAFEEFENGRNGYLVKFKDGSETWIASDVFFDQGNEKEGFEKERYIY